MGQTLSSYRYQMARRKSDLDYAYQLSKNSVYDAYVALKGEWVDEEREASFADGFKAPDAHVILEDRTKLGCFCLSEEEDHVYLQRMYIESSLRGKGIGSGIIKQAFDTAAQQGKALDLTVLRTNEKAYEFYLKRGFAIIQHLPLGYRMRLESAC